MYPKHERMEPITNSRDLSEWQDVALKIAEETRDFATVANEDGSLNIDKTATNIFEDLAELCAELNGIRNLPSLMKAVAGYAMKATTERERETAANAFEAIADAMAITRTIDRGAYLLTIMEYALTDNCAPGVSGKL